MKTVLVTGGCGLIGQHICSGLLKKGNNVIAVDSTEGDYNTGKLHYSFIEASMTDKNKFAEIFENNKIDIVVHAGNIVDNDLGPIITDDIMKNSKACDKFIFRYAMDAGIEKFILLSTDMVYEFPKTREPIREDDDLKPRNNYAEMKLESEKALVGEMKHHKQCMCCILRFSPVYTKNFTENLLSKITDPKDNTKFVYGTGQYGFQFCCVHNLVDFILCYVKNADDMTYAGVYNVSDKLLITASDIIAFMRENHRLGPVLQRKPGKDALSKIFKKFSSKDEKTNYRYLDLSTIENNNMLDNNKASKLLSFRWDIHNTK
ncbi:MAG: NAD(P)-dependent oxidoreductase [Ruminococcus sp.]|nr:NAD(P)-dependent oxidoreductase [Ruminococcus sp.]